MERLDLWRPRSQKRLWMPLSPMIAIGVHWLNRSYLCGGKACRLCELVPLRPVVYFAAMCRSDQKSVTVGLVERSPLVTQEAMRQSGLAWDEAVCRLSVHEEPEGRSVAVVQTEYREVPFRKPIPTEQVAWSVARLYRLPNFPECTDVGYAVGHLQAFALRSQQLHLAGALEVT